MKSGNGYLLMDALLALSVLFMGLLICLEAFSLATRGLQQAEQDKEIQTAIQKEFLHELGLRP